MFEPKTIDRYRRELSAMVKAAGQDDPESFALVVQMLAEAQSQLTDAADALRQPTANGQPGYSWTDLGRALGVTRASAQQRFGRKAAV